MYIAYTELEIAARDLLAILDFVTRIIQGFLQHFENRYIISRCSFSDFTIKEIGAILENLYLACFTFFRHYLLTVISIITNIRNHLLIQQERPQRHIYI